MARRDRRYSPIVLALLAGPGLRLVPAARRPGAIGRAEFHDSHFHLTNYIQEGIDRPTASSRSWARGSAARRCSASRSSRRGPTTNSGDYAPTYYLQSDAPLYYYSFTDAYIASAYLSLPPEKRARFDPMITGFNPADMYAADHIRRVLRTFPGVFTGIGEFSIHKEFVSSKVAGETASLTNPALDRILDFAAEAGLVVLLHSDIDMPFAKTDAEPVYLDADEGPAASAIRRRRSSGRTSGWAASSTRAEHRPPPGRRTKPDRRRDRRGHADRPGAVATSASTSPGTRSPSTSWPRPRSRARGGRVFNRYPDRFLFGTDSDGAAGRHGRTFASTRCTRRSGSRSRRRRAARCAWATTSGSSTRRGAACGRGKRLRRRDRRSMPRLAHLGRLADVPSSSSPSCARLPLHAARVSKRIVLAADVTMVCVVAEIRPRPADPHRARPARRDCRFPPTPTTASRPRGRSRTSTSPASSCGSIPNLIKAFAMVKMAAARANHDCGQF